MISLCIRIENTLGKWENAGYQHFFLFQQCFANPQFFKLKVVKSQDCVVKSYYNCITGKFDCKMQIISPVYSDWIYTGKLYLKDAFDL